MSDNLYDVRFYARVYDNILDKVECEDTISQIKDLEFEQHKFYNHTTGEIAPASGEDELDFFTDVNGEVKNSSLIIDSLSKAIAQYQSEIRFPWFSSWDGFSPIKYNRYTKNKRMAQHCDHIKALFEGERRGIPILTCLGILNNDYTGGEFKLWGGATIDIKPGDLLIFPSNFMYPHMVEPVKSGTRYSYISWVW